jgi:methylenetetrahydrofolate--tRNA-(uracil-5-)-methyltransferase
MPPNFGLLPELNTRIRDKRERYGAYRDRALADLEREMIESSNHKQLKHLQLL